MYIYMYAYKYTHTYILSVRGRATFLEAVGLTGKASRHTSFPPVRKDVRKIVRSSEDRMSPAREAVAEEKVCLHALRGVKTWGLLWPFTSQINKFMGRSYFRLNKHLKGWKVWRSEWVTSYGHGGRWKSEIRSRIKKCLLPLLFSSSDITSTQQQTPSCNQSFRRLALMDISQRRDYWPLVT